MDMFEAPAAVLARVQDGLHARHRQWGRAVLTDSGSCFQCSVFATEALDAVVADPEALDALARHTRARAKSGVPSGSWVYVLESGGRYKIGTTTDVGARMAQLQRSCPHPIRVLITLKGGREAEKRLHERWSHRRLHGEWFALTTEEAENLQGEVIVGWLQDWMAAPVEDQGFLLQGLSEHTLNVLGAVIDDAIVVREAMEVGGG